MARASPTTASSNRSAAGGGARFSPDGRWLAYASDESGRPEIYVQPYPGPGGKWQVSTNGGTEPVWNPNGRELFYREGARMLAVPVVTQPTFSAGRAMLLFEGEYLVSAFPFTSQLYDVDRSGERFLMIKPLGGNNAPTAAAQLHIVLNWTEELKRLVPVR